MTDFDKGLILQEIIELTGHRERRPGDVTLADYCLATGVSDCTAKRRLDRLVEQGILETCKAMESGRRLRVYWKVGHEQASLD